MTTAPITTEGIEINEIKKPKIKHTLSEKGRKEYDEFMNEQFRILMGHHSTIMLRCTNKFLEIAIREEKNDTK